MCVGTIYDYIGLCDAADVMYFIHPEYTGKEIGGLVMKRVEDESRMIGIKRLLVDISTNNVGSIKFHRKNGFEEYERLGDIGTKFGKSFGIVYMVKELD